MPHHDPRGESPTNVRPGDDADRRDPKGGDEMPDPRDGEPSDDPRGGDVIRRDLGPGDGDDLPPGEDYETPPR